MANRSEESGSEERNRGDRTGDRGRSDEDIRGGSDESIRGGTDEDEEFEEADEVEDDESEGAE